jgi:hypothetical protein
MDQCVVSLSYVFEPKSHFYTKAEIEAFGERACATAETSLRAQGHPVEIQCEKYAEDYTKTLNQQVIERVQNSDIVIVEVSEGNINVFLELGMALGAARHTILLQHESQPPDQYADIRGKLTIRYRHIDNVRGQLAKAIGEAVQDILTKQDHFSTSMRQVWRFGTKSPLFINLIGPDSRRQNALPHGARPSRSEPDYARIERIGDKDSIYEAQMQLAHVYTSQQIYTYPSSWFPVTHYDESLVVIGGPLGDESNGNGQASETSGGNALTQEINKRCNLPISYSKDCNTLYLDGQEYKTEYVSPEAEVMLADHGVLARLPNPWNPEQRLLLFQGTHTYGVLGAVRSLVNCPAGRMNVETITRVCGPDPLFYAWCKVAITGQALIIPILKEAQIVRFSQAV